MKVYWSQKEIPALKALSRKEREAAKREVIARVWKHWQVWLPFATVTAAYIVFVVFAPRFPFRFPIVLVTALAALRVAALPFNHYLDFYLSRNDPESQP